MGQPISCFPAAVLVICCHINSFELHSLAIHLMRMPGCSKLTSTLSACHASGTHFIPLETETLSDLSATVEVMFEQLATVLVAKPSSFILAR